MSITVLIANTIMMKLKLSIEIALPSPKLLQFSGLFSGKSRLAPGKKCG